MGEVRSICAVLSCKCTFDVLRCAHLTVSAKARRTGSCRRVKRKDSDVASGGVHSRRDSITAITW
jgi:hypothetical protein